MAEFSYNNDLIHYTDEGEGSELVFIHGLGGNSMNWLYQRQFFKKNYRVLALDLPGHGRSKDAQGILFEEFHFLIRHWLQEHLGIDDAIVCGISMGGRVAIDLASYHREMVRGLILADTFAYLDDEAAETRRRIFSLLDKENGVDRWIEEVIDVMGIDPESTIAKGFHKGMRENDVAYIHRLFLKLQEYDQRDRLGNIDAPTLVLHGERDRFIPLDSGRELARSIPRARLQLVANSGHLPHVEQPRTFNEYVEAFLQEL